MRKRLISGMVATVGALALLATAAPAHAQGLQLNRGNYLAIGDSYSSGAFLGGDLDAECDRSSKAYPVLLAGAADKVNFTACSGDDIQDVLADLPRRPRPNVKVITLTLGAQETNWQELATQCAVQGCPDGAVQQFFTDLVALGAAVGPAIEALHEAYPKATIYWGGYALPVSPAFVSGTCEVPISLPGLPPSATITPDQAFLVNTAVTLLNETIFDAITQAKQAGAPVLYVNPNPGFVGHRYCDDEPWLINLHPSAEGQEAYAAAFEAAGVGNEALLRQDAQDRAAERRAEALVKRAEAAAKRASR